MPLGAGPLLAVHSATRVRHSLGPTLDHTGMAVSFGLLSSGPVDREWPGHHGWAPGRQHLVEPAKKFRDRSDVLAVSAAGSEAAELVLSLPFKLRIAWLGCKHLRVPAVPPLQAVKACLEVASVADLDAAGPSRRIGHTDVVDDRLGQQRLLANAFSQDVSLPEVSRDRRRDCGPLCPAEAWVPIALRRPTFTAAHDTIVAVQRRRFIEPDQMATDLEDGR